MKIIKKIIFFNLALFSGLFFFIFQLYFIYHYLDIDVANYYVQIQKQQWFHPHHLFYNITGWIWLKIFSNFDISDFLKLKLMNIFFGSIGIILSFYLFYSISNKFLISILFTIYIGISLDYIFYSQINDTAFLPLFFDIVFLLYLSYIKKINIMNLFILSFLFTLCVGYHQTNIFLLFTGIFWLLNKNTKYKYVQVLLLILLCTSLIFLLYITIGHYLLEYNFDTTKKPIQGIPGGGNFFDWFFMYGHWDKELKWGTFERKNLLTTFLFTFTNSLFYHNIYNFNKFIENLINLYYHYHTTFNLEEFTLFIFIILIIFSIFFSIILIFIFKKIYLIGFVLWLFFHNFLILWWEPTNKEFMLIPLFTIILIQFFCIYELFHIVKNKIFHFFIYIFINIVFVFYIFFIFTCNYKNFLLPKQYKTFFGHWEDLYDQNYFINIIKNDFTISFPLKEDLNLLIKKKLKFLNDLKQKLSKKENERFFKYYYFQYKNTLKTIEKLYTENNFQSEIPINIEELYNELDQIQNDYENWRINYLNNQKLIK